MNFYIKSATLIDSANTLNGKKVFILIENGIITQISEQPLNVSAETQVVELENLHVSAGWFDLRSNLNDPGFEQKENISTGCKAAAYGGFTSIASTTATNPVIDNKSLVEYVINKSKAEIVSVYPLGCVSDKREGKNIAEMYEMSLAGAIAFSDNKKTINDSGLLYRALLYSKDFNALIMQFAEDKGIARDGKVNEGEVSTRLGLKGIPHLAEEIMVIRDIFIAEYIDSPIHFMAISSAKSVDIIRNAKKRGLKVTCDVNAHQLFFTDEKLVEFDSYYKVKPPLRIQKDIDAIIAGLIDGTIDAICSDHTPQEVEAKIKEFDLADFGIIGSETAFSCAHTILKKHLSITRIIDLFTANPRKIVRIKNPEIKVGSSAELTLFNPELKYTFLEKNIKSKSRNTPFIGTPFTGKALGIINKGKIYLNN